MKKKNIIFVIILATLLTFGTYTYTYLTEVAPSLIDEKIALQDITNVKIEFSEKLIIMEPKEKTDIGIIFYPGGKVDYKAYMRLGSLISQYGYKVYIPEMPFNLAVLGISKAREIMEKNPEIKSWYLSGHSLGGASVAEFYKKNPEGIKGIIYLASYPNFDMSGTDLKTLGIFATEDGLIDKEKRDEKIKNYPKNSEVYLIEGGNHAGFGSYGIQKNDKNASVSGEKQQKIVSEKINEFIKK